MATLVNRERAYLTLKALDSKAPDEVLAMTAKGWLLKEALNELVLFNDGDGFLANGTSPVELFGVRLEAFLAFSTLGRFTVVVLVLS